MTGVCETCGGRTWTLIDQQWRCVQCVLPFRRARRLQQEIDRLRGWLEWMRTRGVATESATIARALAGDKVPAEVGDGAVLAVRRYAEDLRRLAQQPGRPSDEHEGAA